MLRSVTVARALVWPHPTVCHDARSEGRHIAAAWFSCDGAVPAARNLWREVCCRPWHRGKLGCAGAFVPRAKQRIGAVGGRGGGASTYHQRRRAGCVRCDRRATAAAGDVPTLWHPDPLPLDEVRRGEVVPADISSQGARRIIYIYIIIIYYIINIILYYCPIARAECTGVNRTHQYSGPLPPTTCVLYCTKMWYILCTGSQNIPFGCINRRSRAMTVVRYNRIDEDIHL